MVKRRRVVCVGVAVAVVAIILCLGWWSSQPPSRRMHVENASRIQSGMSQAEVETLLGGPPGNYGRYVNGQMFMTTEGFIAPPGSAERVWCDDSNRLEIYFDGQGQVVGYHKRASYQQIPPDGLIERLWRSVRRSLGL